MTPPQLLDGEKAYQFLRQIVRDERVTLLAISVAGGPPRATSFSIDDRIGILAWLTRHNGVDNCYFQVNPLRNDVRNKKTTKAELKHVVQLHVDIDDLKGLDRLREFELPPTAVVCSGNGYHGYWQLAEPLADLAQAEGLNLRLCERLGGDRGTQNADRILRVPFTSNIPDAKKQDRGKVTVRAHVVDDLTDFARAYPLGEIEVALTKTALTTAVGSAPHDPLYLPPALSTEIQELIRTGGKIGPGGYKSRSEPRWRVTNEMARAGLDRTTMRSILTNPKFGISASILDKKNPAEYVDHEIERAFQLLASAWDKSSTGTIKATLRNAQLAIARLDLHCTHDRFKNRMYVQGHAVQQFNGEMTDNVAARIRDLILQKFGFDPGKDHTRDALHQLALANTFNSMTDYFDRLSWDGTPRLHQMLIDYFGAEDTPFNRAVSATFMIAGVRRARHPGTKFDSVVVLEGPQGAGKSSALTLLAGRENFSDQDVLTLETRAQAESVEGVLIYEISELGGLSKVELDRVKAFLSRAEDRARPAYGRFREDHPRTAVFVGTTNDDTYLRDKTGNRRFWPVKVGMIDLERLKADRDQLWAEAALREARGEATELPPALYAAAKELQESRLEPEPWLDTLTYFTCVAEDDVQKVSSEYLLEEVLKIPIDKQTTAIAKRLASAMRQLGWEGPKPIRIRGRVVRGYIRGYAQKKLPL